MADNRPTPTTQDSASQGVYAVGYHHDLVDFVGSRRAARQAKFLLPYLRSGMRLLDCGCGPGTITTDLAEIIAPAAALGIDVEPTQIDAARAYAASRGVRNVRFEVADVYDLPFAEGAFDAVFIHGVLEHLQHPVRALTEVRRVLSVGGVLGIRHGDLGGHLLAPTDPLVERFFTLWRQTSEHDGADPDFGRHQLARLREAGFGNVLASASYDCWSETPAATARMARFMITHITESKVAAQAIELGLVDRAAVEESVAATEAWGRDPTSFAAEAWCEAVAWR